MLLLALAVCGLVVGLNCTDAMGCKHWVLDIYQCYTGFVVHGGAANGTARYFANTHRPVFIAKSVLYVTQTLLGDAFTVSMFFALPL